VARPRLDHYVVNVECRGKSEVLAIAVEHPHAVVERCAMEYGPDFGVNGFSQMDSSWMRLGTGSGRSCRSTLRRPWLQCTPRRPGDG
jgi:hypothetical protein